MSQLCAICSSLLSKWDLDKYPGLHSGTPSFKFGRVDEVQRRKKCSLCQLLFSLVPLPEPSAVDTDPEHDSNATLGAQIDNLVHVSGDKDPCDLDVYLNPTMEGGMMKGVRIGSLTTKQLWQPDIAELSVSAVRWEIEDCDKFHPKDALDDGGSNPWIHIRLIDVLSNRVCESTIDERFLALSYVWGGISGLQATIDNREELFAPGALSDMDPRIPQVIKDAMEVTRMLGERFLWVDSLCIEQDNATHKAEQIAHMDRIYLRSILTIMALSGQSGRACLPGVRPGTTLDSRASATLNGRQVFVRPPSLYEVFESSRYETRGWTFQERCLSPRILIFTQHTWYYHCHGELISNGLWWQKRESSSHRSLFETLNLLRGRGEELTTSHAPTPAIAEFFRYEAIVLIYTARNLSYYSDALNAVSALLAGVSMKMRSVFVQGLPERFFGLSLLWIPTGHYPANSGPIRKRNTDSQGHALFPSWTWLGWVGQTHYAPGLLMPCFPSKDDVEHWLEGGDPVGFIDDVSSYVLATDDGAVEERRLYTTRRPTDFTPLCPIDSAAVDKTAWTHLVFEACTADALNFSLHPASINKPWCLGGFQNINFTNWHPTRIMDGKGQHCGCLYENAEEGFNLQIDLTHCKFIALSSSNAACLAPGACCDPANPVPEAKSVERTVVREDSGSEDDEFKTWVPKGGWENFKPRHECQIKDFMFDKSCFGLAEWCFVNVMLISWAAGRAERVGVGIVHRDAWVAVGQTRETVHLY